MGNLAALIFPVLDLNAECWASVRRRNARSAARRHGSLSPTAGSDEVQGVASQRPALTRHVFKNCQVWHFSGFTFGSTHNPLSRANQTVIEPQLKGPLTLVGLEWMYFWPGRLFALKANCEIQDKQSFTETKKKKGGAVKSTTQTGVIANL